MSADQDTPETLGEWAGWRVVPHPSAHEYGFAVIAPDGNQRRYGWTSREITAHEADRLIWSSAIGHHADLKAADPDKYAYWLADDARDEALMRGHS